MSRINFRVDIAEIESILKYSFKNKDLLREALQSYYRLEFLGDAVLEFLMAVHVYKTNTERINKFTFCDLVKKNVENGVLGRAAINNNFHNFLLDNNLKNKANELKKAMANDSISDNDVKPFKVLANLIEALAGAVHVDSAFSFEKVWEVFQPLLKPLLKKKSHEPNIGVSSSITTPSTSVTQPTKETQSSKEKKDRYPCNCNETKMFIENLISELYKPSYKSDVLDDIEAKLNYNFKRRDLLKESFCVLLEMVARNRFTQCNACKQALESAGLRSYELMELFGNFFLKLAITIDLYKKYPTLEVGILTKLRSQIMDNENLAKVAVNKLYLHNHISCANVSLDRKIKTFIDDMTKYKDLNPPEVLFNSVETIAGAMFVDSSKLTENIGCCLEQVWEKLENLLEPLVTPETLDEHPVSKLQELCKKSGKHVEYKHHTLKVFDEEEMRVVEVFINDTKFGMGECIKKEVAKKRGARDALAQLEQASED
ncbi:hypothetical protein SUGI_0712440 [Cryptomeria japonica]|nr:hypothetical protein SUGI_0712440 [Cryptomeria japonica]